MNISHNGRFHTAHLMFVRGYKFGEINNLNLVEACQSKIFALILIIICGKKVVKNRDYNNNYCLTKTNCQGGFSRLCNMP